MSQIYTNDTLFEQFQMRQEHGQTWLQRGILDKRQDAAVRALVVTVPADTDGFEVLQTAIWRALDVFGSSHPNVLDLYLSHIRAKRFGDLSALVTMHYKRMRFALPTLPADFTAAIRKGTEYVTVYRASADPSAPETPILDPDTGLPAGQILVADPMKEFPRPKAEQFPISVRRMYVETVLNQSPAGVTGVLENSVNSDRLIAGGYAWKEGELRYDTHEQDWAEQAQQAYSFHVEYSFTGRRGGWVKQEAVWVPDDGKQPGQWEVNDVPMYLTAPYIGAFPVHA